MVWNINSEPFPRALTNEEIINNCKFLLIKYGSNIPIVYQEKELVINIFDDGDLKFCFHHGDVACVLVHLGLNASIMNITASKYLGKDGRSGTWLIKFTLTILNALGCKSVSGHDIAHIPIDGGYINLATLRVFQGKEPSWYTSFGFQPLIKYSPELQERINNYPLELIPELKEKYKNISELIQSNLCFGLFMLTLYQNDIKEYMWIIFKLAQICPKLYELLEELVPAYYPLIKYF